MYPRTISDLVGTPIIFKEGVEALGAAPRSKSLSDWFGTKTRGYWTEEFQSLYDPKTGSDIDGSWIDMNKPSSVSSHLCISNMCLLRPIQFCAYPCDDPFQQARDQSLPQVRGYPTRPSSRIQLRGRDTC